MANTLIAVPLELKNAIFCCLDDLDDALHLAQVCKEFRTLYNSQKSSITRQIIISSNVYEFDICLSRLQQLDQTLGWCYRNYGKELGPHRPALIAYTSLLDLKDSKRDLSDELVQEICSRWESFGFLRGLYADGTTSQEFERFRARFASKLGLRAKAAIMKEGLAADSINSSHFSHSQFQQNNRFGPEFKARFHRSLCLQSMAILGLRFGKVSRDQPPASWIAPTNRSEQFCREVEESIEALWRRRSVRAGGNTILLNRDTKIDCIEVFDFIYTFLLAKIVPPQRMTSWLGEDKWYHPCFYIDDFGTGYPLPVSEWYLPLKHFRWAFQPCDITHLIDREAWDIVDSDWRRTRRYLQKRAFFDAGEGLADWETPFTRIRMLNELRFTEEVDMEKLGTHRWWGRLRTRLGSPFLPEAMPKYLAEIDKIRSTESGEEEEGEEEEDGEAEEEGDGEEEEEEDMGETNVDEEAAAEL